MPGYFFHLHDAEMTTEDEEGCEMANLEAVSEMAMRAARDIIGHDVLCGIVRLRQHIEVEDENHLPVHRLAFADAIAFEQ